MDNLNLNIKQYDTCMYKTWSKLNYVIFSSKPFSRSRYIHVYVHTSASWNYKRETDIYVSTHKNNIWNLSIYIFPYLTQRQKFPFNFFVLLFFFQTTFVIMLMKVYFYYLGQYFQRDSIDNLRDKQEGNVQCPMSKVTKC